MNPGRELDVLIAEKVMGWDKDFICLCSEEHQKQYTRKGSDICGNCEEQKVLCYSTDIRSAWTAVEKMQYGFGTVEILCQKNASGNEYWTATYLELTEKKAKGISRESPAHAICLLALKVMSAKKGQSDG